MESNNKKIKTFTDLDAWKEGHKLVLMVYKDTDKFPKEEKFGLTQQLRRAVVSVTSNIAEGFSRRSNKEKARFYFISKGSLTEAQNQLFISRDLAYLKVSDFEKIVDQANLVGKLVSGLIKSAGKLNF